MVYYAHSIEKYGTEIEKYELSLIRDHFFAEDIFNPATEVNQRETEEVIMRHCLEAVRAENCLALVFSTNSGVIGRGVAAEIVEAINHGKRIFEISKDELIQRDAVKLRTIGICGRIYAVVETQSLPPAQC